VFIRFAWGLYKVVDPPLKPAVSQRLIGGGVISEFRIATKWSSNLSGGGDFWCNRHCRTSPVVQEGFWGQVWPKICRKPEKSEYRVANEPLSKASRMPLPLVASCLRPGRSGRTGPKAYKCIGFGAIHGPKAYKFIGFGAMAPNPINS
jgi:hypothetical protein